MQSYYDFTTCKIAASWHFGYQTFGILTAVFTKFNKSPKSFNLKTGHFSKKFALGRKYASFEPLCKSLIISVKRKFAFFGHAKQAVLGCQTHRFRCWNVPFHDAKHGVLRAETCRFVRRKSAVPDPRAAASRSNYIVLPHCWIVVTPKIPEKFSPKI